MCADQPPPHTHTHTRARALTIPVSLADVMCVFYVESDGDWIPNGCETVVLSDLTTVQCTCNHLTAFTVLSGASNKPLNKQESDAVSAIS
jgi:hypothetical protein